MAFHIIGDRDTILGFQFAGVAGAPVASAAEAQAAFRQALDRANCRVLILTEQVGEWLAAEAAAHRLTAAPPYLVEIPDLWETPVRRQSLEGMIQEAVGIKLGKEKP
ncbi:MAG: V-type ATP synthase subunit F [Lentisphaeria bacterium]|jgi:vacuolar-type H+-ATPase subunit F/Vma7